MVGTILTIVISAVVGFVAGVFVYRNNTKLFGQYADQVDAKYDALEAKLDAIEAAIKK
jgi:hypothetical protein